MITQAAAPLGAPTCWWDEQVDGLEAHRCDDGQVILWRDDQHNVWLPSEPPPARWKKAFRHHNPSAAFLGAAPLPGICTPHKPVPLTKIRRLQNALRGLATRVRDGSLRIGADGLIGPRTAAATNRAMVTYVLEPAELATGHLTHAQVAAFAPQLTAYIEKAPHPAAAPAFAPSAPPPSPVSYSPPQGAPAMPAYFPDDSQYYPPPRPAYYPPAYYGPTRAPGGLPGGHASLDVKAYVPAQFEHINITPTTGLLLVGLGFAAVYFVIEKKKKGS